MYLPDHFAEHRTDELHLLMHTHPLGILVTHGANGLDANHIPFELDPAVGAKGTLRGHVARANPIWQDVPSGSDVLVIFRGHDAYISPNWYPSKHVDHRQVPTWNYQVVHAHGRITIRDDVAYVRSLVARLAHTHEASQPVPWKMGDAPPDYLNQMLGLIVGLEVEIVTLVGKSKLSQNKDATDRLGAIEALQAAGLEHLADAMSTAPPSLE